MRRAMQFDPFVTRTRAVITAQGKPLTCRLAPTGAAPTAYDPATDTFLGDPVVPGGRIVAALAVTVQLDPFALLVDATPWQTAHAEPYVGQHGTWNGRGYQMQDVADVAPDGLTLLYWVQLTPTSGGAGDD